MLNVHRTIELNKHLAIWLCCLPTDPLADCFMCQHCINHAVVVSGDLGKAFDPAKTALIRRAGMGRVQKAYLGLLPDQRIVIYLKIVLGFSNRDVAEILSRSIGAVKAIQHRALITLTHSLFSEYDLVIA